MRLFLAIEPTPEIRAILGDVLARGADALGPGASALRWIAPENLHLTLHFLGEVDPARTRRLVDALQSPFSLESFTVSLDRFGAFPLSGSPRTIWLGVGQGARHVQQIHVEIGRRLTALGFAIESRPYSPHLTVARVPAEQRERARTIRPALASLAVPPLKWNVSRASLIQSDLSGPQPKYTTLADLMLRGPSR